MPFDQRPGRPGRSEPAINLPPLTLGLIVVLLVLHLLRQMLTDDVDNDLIQTFALIPARYLGDLKADGASLLLAPLTHMFLHGDWAHVAINAATLAAFGAPVERFLGGPRFLLFFLATGLAGSALQAAIYPTSDVPMLGASGAISGLFGGLLLLMRQRGTMTALVPFALLWVAMQLGLGLFGTTAGGDLIAWAAHVGGFFAGLLLIRPFAGWRW
ncbi:MAG TPA: rhomboid family intramembrane serine protease [Vineibacter sp.]|nr:rhomboid family intramembrane serine protease [Vineibacter sp.]